jgi:integrase
MASRYSRRARGEGSVYETAEGRWRASLVIPHPDGSRSVRRVVSGRSKADVVRKLEALKRESASGFASGDTLGGYLARWAAAVKPTLRPATWREYAGHVERYWTPKLGTVALTRLRAGDVERVMAEMMASGRSASTARAARTTLRRALKDAQRDGLVVPNVAALARPPRMERPELRPLSVDETRGLLDSTRNEPYGPVFALLAGSGLRLGEALGLAWSDLGPDSLTVRRSLARADGNGYALAEPKTRRSRRTVPLPAIVMEALARQRTRQDKAKATAGTAWQDRDGLVFTDPVGRPLSPTVVSHAFRDAADALGLSVRLHDLRHTYASTLLRAGVPLKVVSEALGHSSIATTADVYGHLEDTTRRQAADAMNLALPGGAS